MVLASLTETVNSPPFVLQDPKVYGLVGERGSGKSLTMGIFLSEEFKAGRDVFFFPSDFGFKFGRPLDAADLASVPDYLENAAVGIDEINLLMSRYAVTSIRNQLLASFFQQLRKRNCTVYYTTNSPQRMDPIINAHTDFHATVLLYKDQRCKGRHRPDCGDRVRVRWVDTQGKKRRRIALQPGRKVDSRKRGTFTLANAWVYYGLFSTHAKVDTREVFKLTRERLLATDNGRVPSYEPIDVVASAIVEFQQAGYDRVEAQEISEAIKSNWDYEMSARSVGRYLRQLGLARLKSSGNPVWIINPSLAGDLSAQS